MLVCRPQKKRRQNRLRFRANHNHTITAMMVQGPKTMLNDTMTMFSSLLTLGINGAALKQVRNNWTGFVANGIGSLLQALHVQTNWNLNKALRRQRLGRGQLEQVPIKPRLKAIRTTEKGMSRFARSAREVLTGTGLGTGPHQTFRPWAPFSWGSMGLMNASLIDGNISTFEDFVEVAIRYLRANPHLIGDKNVTLTAGQLGYKKGLIFDSEHAFNYLTEALARYGMSLEGVANAAIARQAINPNDTRLFLDNQLQVLATMAMSDLSLEASITSRPTWMQDPLMRASGLLLGWSFARMEQLRKAFREPNGQASWWALKSGLMSMAAVIPLGLAWAWLMDDYDEYATGKKSNIRGFGQDNNFLAAVEQLTRQGTFGFWGDVANTLGNAAGEGDLRGVSVDSRVVWVNSMVNTMSALSTWVRQGEADYPSVYRPLMQALGGSGYIQDAQIFNNFLGLDNPESRVTARINANNYLRAAGRELGLDVRIGRGAQSLANPIKPHVGQMVLAALADDGEGFYVAYREAVEAARDEGRPDPIEFVKRSFASSHPLRAVFKTTPSTAEYRQILGALNERGQEDVSESVSLFNRYAHRLGIREFEGKKEPVSPPASSNADRRAAAFSAAF